MRAVDAVLAALAAHDEPSSWLVGEPCLPPPRALCDALVRAAAAASFPYPPPAGLPHLREVLASRHREGGEGARPQQVVVTTGAKGGLLAVLAALLGPGDELLHPVPCYPAYRDMAQRLGARPVAVPERGDGFAHWPRAVAEALGPRSRAVVVASPSNPSGATLTAGQARELVELCRDRGLVLICDEAYADFRFAADCALLPADFDPGRRVVVQIRSASKSWALCGWRLGWVVADASLAARVAAVHAALFNPAPGPTQEALAALPEVPESYLESARSLVLRRMAELADAFTGTPVTAVPPAGGFYLWLDIRRLAARCEAPSAGALCAAVAGDHGVGLWPGDDFGSPDHARLAVTAPPEASWHQALERLRAALS